MTVPTPTPGPVSASFPCAICEAPTSAATAVPFRAIRGSVRAALEARRGRALGDAEELCMHCLHRARAEQILARLSAQRGALSTIEHEIAAKAASHEAVASNLDSQLATNATFGERVADAVARVGGSWTFVCGFLFGLAVWMFVNSIVLDGRGFDPYPYILLNLVLSCVAALQAPIIMMSQNRATARDRMQADQDFRVNLKAELEVATLHDKVDHLLHEQWESLLAVHQAQLDLLGEIADKVGAAQRGSVPPPSLAG